MNVICKIVVNEVGVFFILCIMSDTRGGFIRYQKKK